MSSLANKDALRAYARDAMVLNSLKAKAIKGEEEEEDDKQVLRAILSSINKYQWSGHINDTACPPAPFSSTVFPHDIFAYGS
jgi:hypothetical protein